MNLSILLFLLLHWRIPEGVLASVHVEAVLRRLEDGDGDGGPDRDDEGEVLPVVLLAVAHVHPVLAGVLQLQLLQAQHRPAGRQKMC